MTFADMKLNNVKFISIEYVAFNIFARCVHIFVTAKFRCMLLSTRCYSYETTSLKK